MELQAIGGAATVALASALVFLLVAKTWNAVSRTISSTPSFSGRIMHEAAQRFRDDRLLQVGVELVQPQVEGLRGQFPHTGQVASEPK